MFGLLNVIFRPLGGFIADLIFRRTNSVWAKKHWITFLGVAMGIFEIAIGMSDPKTEAAMFGLVAGFAFFMDASNGANFAVVPHVHPHSNGMSPPGRMIVGCHCNVIVVLTVSCRCSVWHGRCFRQPRRGYIFNRIQV